VGEEGEEGGLRKICDLRKVLYIKGVKSSTIVIGATKAK
jgi:hypothetical protein